MTYGMLYVCLIEAEQRAADTRLPAVARANSAETVALIEERMRMEGLDRATLKADYMLSQKPAKQPIVTRNRNMLLDR